LVVDDDEATRHVLTEMLSAHGYYVIEATNGREALAWLDGMRPDAILLDLVMPIMDGFEFLDIHLEHPDRRVIPVIILCGVLPTDRRCKETSSLRFMAKPFTEDQVIAAIQAECGHLTA
jgi:two-component system chemotaxis response regulator CheY